jgi:ribonuclease-3
MRPLSLNKLCSQLGYLEFQNNHLLEEALTHRSVGIQKSNERLEYLGDAVLNLVVTNALFVHNPKSSEGELSRIRAYLVCEERLAALSRRFGLGGYLRLGASEAKNGGRQRDSLLADGLEAVIGAIFLDGGFAACEACILDWYRGQFHFDQAHSYKDSKTRLQECLQAKGFLPKYTHTKTGKPHCLVFHATCYVAGFPDTHGTGSSLRRAEQQAASEMLIQLGL